MHYLLKLGLSWLSLTLVGGASRASVPTDSISLEGTWAFRIDSLDRGEAEGWFSQRLPESVTLPGSLATNGKGDEVRLETRWVGEVQQPGWYLDPTYAPYLDPDSLRFPFWLQPVKKTPGQRGTKKKLPCQPPGKDAR